MDSLTIEEIKRKNRDAGLHFFDPSTLRFFRSRIAPTVYQGPGGIYFLTSEQFVPSSGPGQPRRFTVRQFNPESGDIDTVGEFNKLTRPVAVRLAKHYAESGPPTD